MKISELFTGIDVPAYELEDPGTVDPERVLARIRARMGARANGKTPRRLGRALLAAAVLTALLSVTAWAVYEHFVEDYVIEQPDPLDPAPTSQEESRISLVGYQGTPEYQAYVEWDAMQERWSSESEAAWAQNGMDDTWHETPYNYAAYYRAVTREQAAELDALMEKYGLTLHEHRSTLLREGDFYTTLGLESLCQLLDMDVFIHNDCDAYGGYVYDDGTFKLEASKNSEIGEGRHDSAFSLFVSAKGSFTDIYANFPAPYEQWGYTVGRQELTLALIDTGGIILTELPGAYVYLSSSAGSREALEALADTVDFDALAARYDGTPLDLTQGMEAMDEKYEAWQADYMAAHDPHPEAAELPQFDDSEQALDWALDQLGDWAWIEPPAGYSLLWRQGLCQPDGERRTGEDSTNVYAIYVSSYYEGQDGGLSLIYKRLYADTALTESVNEWEMEGNELLNPDSTAFQLEGCRALYTPSNYGIEPQSVLWWLDEERDLVFQLCVSGEQTPLEELQGYAEALIADMEVSP